MTFKLAKIIMENEKTITECNGKLKEMIKNRGRSLSVEETQTIQQYLASTIQISKINSGKTKQEIIEIFTNHITAQENLIAVFKARGL